LLSEIILEVGEKSVPTEEDHFEESHDSEFDGIELLKIPDTRGDERN
jgi:hypothetical protein